MDKYALLMIFNLPFIVFGLLKAFQMFKNASISISGLIARFTFWISILLGLMFAKNIYNYLRLNDLTDSPPLSLADVILITGVIFCFFLSIRVYAKLDAVEKRLNDLHTKLSIKNFRDNDLN